MSLYEKSMEEEALEMAAAAMKELRYFVLKNQGFPANAKKKYDFLNADINAIFAKWLNKAGFEYSEHLAPEGAYSQTNTIVVYGWKQPW